MNFTFLPVKTGRKLSRLCLIDKEDLEKCQKYTWRDDHGYVRSNNNIYLHKLLTPYSKVDHANQDTYDNRKQNLREASQSQNCANKRKSSGYFKSQYKGVARSTHNTGWTAQIRVNYKTIYLGTFKSETTAAKTYDSAARKYFGEFAYCNFNETSSN